MKTIDLYEERSRSRRGLHQRRRIALKICGEKIEYISGERVRTRPLYSVGEAYLVKTRVDEGCYAAQIDLVMNPRKRVRGYIVLYDSRGEPVLKMKYRKLKFKLVEGSPGYRDVFMRVIGYLKIPYKNINWRKT